MAADVRDSKSESETVMQDEVEETEDALFYPSRSSSDSRITLNSEISSIPENEKDSRSRSLPSYVIVQKQMKDVILSQKAMVQQLARYNIDSLNASKQSFSIAFGTQERKIEQLELSIERDFVRKEVYSELRRKLQTECEEHSVTKGKLYEVQNRLASTQHHLAKAEQKMTQEKETFSLSSDALKHRIIELEEQNSKLQFLLKEKTLECEEVKGQVVQHTAHIAKQSKKHEEQKVRLRQQVSEAEIEKQQEAYLSRLLTDTGKSGKKKKS